MRGEGRVILKPLQSKKPIIILISKIAVDSRTSREEKRAANSGKGGEEPYMRCHRRPIGKRGGRTFDEKNVRAARKRPLR